MRADDEGTVARDMKERTEEPEQQTLVSLLARIARQDETALAEFYDATVARAYALACRITREARGGEEVVLDVYFQVWQQAQRYNSLRGTVLAWLLTVCRSRAIDYLRRRDITELHPAPDDLRPDLYTSDEGPFDLLLAVERSSRLHAALACLEDRQRHLIGLAYFEGLSHDEIAKQTGIPLGSVKTTLRSSMQALHETLASALLVSGPASSLRPEESP